MQVDIPAILTSLRQECSAAFSHGREDAELGWGGVGPPGRDDTLECPPVAWLILVVYVHLSVGLIIIWSPQVLHLGPHKIISNLINMTDK